MKRCKLHKGPVDGMVVARPKGDIVVNLPGRRVIYRLRTKAGKNADFVGYEVKAPRL